MDIKTINIIGAGSLGSFATLLLSKMFDLFACPIKVIDFDTVVSHNVRNQ